MKSTMKAALCAACLCASTAFAQTVDGRIHSFVATPEPSAVGQPTRLIAVINFQDIKPSGTTAYYDNGVVIPGCEALPYDGSGNPQPCIDSFQVAGTHTLTATYSGDNTYPSSSAQISHVVDTGKWTPTFDVYPTDDPSIPVVKYLNMRIIDVTSWTTDTTASGTVTFYDGTVQLRDCVDVPVVSGIAQCHEPFSRGSHPVTAQYTGDAKYAAGTSSVRLVSSSGRKILVDFDGDNKGDLLFVNRNDNSVQAWLQNGLTTTAQPTIAGPSTLTGTWRAGDFNGDGTTDLLEQTSDGAATLYLMSGGAVSSQVQLRGPQSGWHVTHVADFNNDARSDILWRNDDGSVEMWLMDGSTSIQQATIMPAGTGWRVKLVGDFDGDGRADLVWVNDADGSVGVWIMDGTTRLDRNTIMPGNTGWTPSFLADFDDDGKSDIVWTHSGGSVGLWYMEGTQQRARTPLMGPGTGWSVTQVSDLTNEIFWKHTSGNVGVWVLGPTNTSHTPLQGSGSTWTVTATQDVDGDRSADFLWVSTTGSVGLWNMIGTYQLGRRNLLPDGTPWQLLNAQIAPNSP